MNAVGQSHKDSGSSLHAWTTVTISDSVFPHLQAVQNAAVRLVTDTGCHEYITPDSGQLHWLPVRRHIELR